MRINKYITEYYNGLLKLNSNKHVNIILAILFIFYSAHISGDNYVPEFLFIFIENPFLRLVSFTTILIVIINNFALGLLLAMAYCLTLLTYDKQIGNKIINEGFANFNTIMRK